MSRSAQEILLQEFLQTRAKILEVAAFYDRLDCSPSDSQPGDSQSGDSQPSHGVNEPAVQQLQAACHILTDDEADKAARVQLLFSREFNPQWRKQFGI